MQIKLRILAAVALLSAVFACKKDEPPAAEPPAAAPVARTIMEAPDQFFTRDSARLRYREAGQGAPLVILHGYSDRLEGMAALADSLGAGFRVIVLDHRGFGQSTKFSDPERYGHEMSDDVIGLLDHLQISRAHLIGHSMGAAIAEDVALRYPARVESVSLIAGPFYADSAKFVAMARPYVDDLSKGKGLIRFLEWLFPGIPDTLAAEYSRQALAANDLGAMKAVLPAMAELMVPAGARPDTSIEVLLVVGAGDPLLANSRALKRLWPSARLVEVAGANHDDVRAKGETVAAIRETVRR